MTEAGQRQLAAIVFTDVVEFTRKVESAEDRTILAVRRDLETMAELCKRYEGTVVKSLGDGLMILFASAVNAVQCALEIQTVLNARHAEEPVETRLVHRIGVHLGDVLVTPGDAHGEGVNVARRLEQECQPGGICISQGVYDVVKNRLTLEVTKLRDLQLKNVAQPILAYRVNGVGAPTARKEFRLHWATVAGAALVLVGITASVTALLIQRPDGSVQARVPNPSVRRDLSLRNPPAPAEPDDLPFIWDETEFARQVDEKIRTATQTFPIISVKNEEIGEFLAQLFKNQDARYQLDPLVKGKVSIQSADQPFEEVLSQALEQVGAAYRVDDGVYIIQKIAPPGSLQPADDSATSKIVVAKTNPPTTVPKESLTKTPNSNPPVKAPVPPAPTSPIDPGASATASTTAFRMAWERTVAKFDFEGMVRWLESQPESPERNALLRRYDRHAETYALFKAALAASSETAPLGRPSGMRIWQTEPGKVAALRPGESRPIVRLLSEVPVMQHLDYISVALLQSQNRGSNPGIALRVSALTVEFVSRSPRSPASRP